MKNVLLVLLPALLQAQELKQLAGFAFRTNPHQKAILDLDLEKMRTVMRDGNMAEFRDSQEVYEFGAHSLSYAVVEITTAGEADSYDAGTEIIGPMKHDNDYDVVGYLMDDVSWTANDTTAILRIQYAPMEAEDNERYLECYVGGLWMFNGEGQATLGGCFNDTGTLGIFDETAPEPNGWQFPYVYVDNSIRTSNLNDLSFQKLSKSAISRMSCESANPYCNDDYYKDFQLFYDYFGETDFADKWVTSLFTLDPALFDSGYGNAADNELYFRDDARARSHGITFGISTMIMLHEMIRDLELVSFECHKKNKLEAFAHLDNAYASYTGSLEGPTGEGKGLFMYELAQLRCNQTQTCGRNHDSNGDDAYVNYEVLRNMVDIQEALEDHDCTSIRASVKDIVRVVKIPLIQGILRYAYENEYDSFGTQRILDGAVFMTAMLPWMDDCDGDRTLEVYDNMRVRQFPGPISYKEVRAALESMYRCLDVACEEIGGMWNRQDEEWRINGEPCNHFTKADRISSGSSSKNTGLAVGLTFMVLIILALLILVVLKCRKRRAAASTEKPQPRNIAAVTEIS